MEPAGALEPDRQHKRRIYSTDPTYEAARDLSFDVSSRQTRLAQLDRLGRRPLGARPSYTALTTACTFLRFGPDLELERYNVC
jgi:hypothetical protein